VSLNIQVEARMLLLSVAFGAGLSVLYDLLRLWRCLLRHSWLWTGLEDLAYWIFSGFAVFYLLYRENDGALRLYVIAVILLTMAVCDAAGRHISRSVFGKLLKKRKR